MKLRPIGSRVVVRLEKAKDRTASGLYIPDNAKERPMKGEVLAVGPGRITDNGSRLVLDVSIGDVVLIERYGAIPIPGEEDLVVVSQDNILSVVEI